MRRTVSNARANFPRAPSAVCKGVPPLGVGAEGGRAMLRLVSMTNAVAVLFIFKIIRKLFPIYESYYYDPFHEEITPIMVMVVVMDMMMLRSIIAETTMS